MMTNVLTQVETKLTLYHESISYITYTASATLHSANTSKSLSLAIKLNVFSLHFDQTSTKTMTDRWVVR